MVPAVELRTEESELRLPEVIRLLRDDWRTAPEEPLRDTAWRDAEATLRETLVLEETPPLRGAYILEDEPPETITLPGWQW